jgi:hypothetical protein
MLQEWKA